VDLFLSNSRVLELCILSSLSFVNSLELSTVLPCHACIVAVAPSSNSLSYMCVYVCCCCCCYLLLSMWCVMCCCALVLNALDNMSARNHVNRLCLAADVPLVESGTAGQFQCLLGGLVSRTLTVSALLHVRLCSR
jgi:hypothetical protein